MAEATSIVGRFDGIVTYDDETWGSFHCQIETFDLTNDLVWSLAEAFSEEHMQRMYADANKKAVIEAFVETLPFVSSITWTDTALADKTITDAVLHLYLLITFDDGTTYPVSLTAEKGEIRYHTESATDLLSGAGNLGTMLDKIETMLEKIMDSVTLA